MRGYGEAAAGGPTVSVVLPAYDVEPFVAEAVDTIHAQTWPDIELIAVDDGSRDGTAGVLDALADGWTEPGRRMTVLHQANAGAGAARNAALARTTGPFVAFADADDRWHPDLIARSVALLWDDPSLAYTFPLCRYIDADGNVTGLRPPVSQDRFAAIDILVANPIHTGTGIVARRSAVDRVDGFDPDLTSCIDMDYWIALAGEGEGRVGCVADHLVDYRRRSGQITADLSRMRRGHDQLVAKWDRLGLRPSRAQRRLMRARFALYWATVAYQTGDHRAARRHVLSALAHDPRAMAKDPLWRVRLAACAATLLPPPLHDGLRSWFNGRATT
ncbi:glycosyltransferase [Jannaschia sp. LMIT008]|uniref:glycosyltransferase n=1 Tax=Jannaschia maritima TaxID=3032585 RepID=UPI0028125097|nr:glycosyltransferase [Jannaschia sp. LMIT008]